MIKKDIIAVIDTEIVWCKESPEFNYTDEYQKAFINGLEQAKFLIEALEN